MSERPTSEKARRIQGDVVVIYKNVKIRNNHGMQSRPVYSFQPPTDENVTSEQLTTLIEIITAQKPLGKSGGKRKYKAR